MLHRNDTANAHSPSMRSVRAPGDTLQFTSVVDLDGLDAFGSGIGGSISVPRSITTSPITRTEISCPDSARQTLNDINQLHNPALVSLDTIYITDRLSTQY